MHLFLALLYALLIFLCAKVLVQFSTSAVSLGIAVLLFAINDTHASAVGWIASYNTILCCIFGFYSFLLYTRWRQKKEHGALVLSIALFMISLLSSEGGLALMGYLIAYALFIEKNNWLKKAAHLSPYVIISLGYVAFYTLHHYGAKCSGVYLSPADDPAGTFFSVLSNTLVLTVSQIFSFAPLTIIFAQAGVVGTIAALLFFIISFVLLRKFIFSNSKVAFFGTGMLLSIIPFTLLSAPMDRLLMWSGFGAAGFLGELFTMQINKIGKVQKFFTRTLLFNNTVFSLLFFIPVQFLMTGFDKPAQLIAQQVTVDKTILLNAPFDVILMYPPAFKCEKGEDWPEHFYCLYAGADTLIIKRTAENELLATTTRGWFAADGEQTTRPEYLPFKEGDTVDLQLMSAKIEKVSSDGRPLGVTFTFKNDISEYSWLKWENKEPRKCKLPPVGGEMKLFASFF